MSIEKLNRAAKAAGCAMAPPVELFEEPKAGTAATGWTAARHDAKSSEPQRSAWRELLAGWTTKAPA